jgi:DMSO/TMAO reductase YedYZ heme-binding membrane subunit
MKRQRTSRSSAAPGTGLSRPAQGALTAAVVGLLPGVAIRGGTALRAALDFTTGVLALLCLTASIAWGLLATDRLLFSPRHRLVAQAVHRATAAAALGFLLLHATVKVSLGRVDLIGALIPFGLGVSGTASLIGFGSLAGLLMVVAGATGVLRSALAGSVRTAGRWRALHMLAYPAWCAALVHGLFAGRPAAAWVVAMYCLTLTAVAAAVSVRLLPPRLQRRLADRFLVLTGGSAGRDGERGRRNGGQAPGTTDAAATPPVGGLYDGIPSQRRYESELHREQGATRADRTGVPAGPDRPRLEPPSPQLYEVPLPPDTISGVLPGSLAASGGMAPPGSGPVRRPGRRRKPHGTSTPAGAGISAGYRAVSRPGPPSAPLAERIPMTEELPVIDDRTEPPGHWPAPAPPPPGSSPGPSGTDPAYGGRRPAHTFPSEPVRPGAPGRDAPYTPMGNSTGVYAAAGQGIPGTPTPGGAPYTAPPFPGRPAGERATHDHPAPGAPPRYETPAAAPYPAPGTSPVAPPSPYGTDSAAPYDDTTRTAPGPLFPPQAGEPWGTTAGDRP